MSCFLKNHLVEERQKNPQVSGACCAVLTARAGGGRGRRPSPRPPSAHPLGRWNPASHQPPEVGAGPPQDLQRTVSRQSVLASWLWERGFRAASSLQPAASWWAVRASSRGPGPEKDREERCHLLPQAELPDPAWTALSPDCTRSLPQDRESRSMLVPAGLAPSSLPLTAFSFPFLC